MASKFLNKILKSVEISEKEDEKDINSKIITKNVYFQLTPETYLIDNKTVNNFLKTANRESRSAKLKSILEKLPDYLHEINYKTEFMQKRKFDWAYNFDFINIDKFNCIFCFILNFLYLFSLNKNLFSTYLLNKTSTLMEFILIMVNCLFIVLFTFYEISS